MLISQYGHCRQGDCVRLVCACVWVRVCVFEGVRACVSVRVWVWLVWCVRRCWDCIIFLPGRRHTNSVEVVVLGVLRAAAAALQFTDVPGRYCSGPSSAQDAVHATCAKQHGQVHVFCFCLLCTHCQSADSERVLLHPSQVHDSRVYLPCNKSTGT